MCAEQIAEARSLHEAGQTFRAIARTVGANRETIRMALRVPVQELPAPVSDVRPAHASVPTLSQIRELWALDQLAAPDDGWWPPSGGYRPEFAAGP